MLQFLLNQRPLRLHDSRNLHHGSTRLRLQAGLRQMQDLSFRRSVARIHGPLELRMRFVLSPGELRLCHSDFTRSESGR
jgi:hypothetical protein